AGMGLAPRFGGTMASRLASEIKPFLGEPPLHARSKTVERQGLKVTVFTRRVGTTTEWAIEDGQLDALLMMTVGEIPADVFIWPKQGELPISEEVIERVFEGPAQANARAIRDALPPAVETRKFTLDRNGHQT